MESKVEKAEHFRGMDQSRRLEAAVALRKRLLDIRMDIYTPSAQHGGEKRKVRRNLARLLTVLNEDRRAAVKAAVKAPVAPKVAAKPIAKAKAAKTPVKAKEPKTTKKSK